MSASPPPIILLGAHRSGTTWLGDALSRAPGVAYWVEPRHIWTRGNAYRRDDVLTAADATPRIRQGIRASFDRFVREHNAERFAEKTPSNCLRVPFIHAVYPEARFLVIIRDGRSVLRSTAEIHKKGVRGARIVRRMRQVPLWEWPAYGFQLTDALRAKLLKRPLKFWGPRPPGWRQWVGADPRDVILSKQWAGCVRHLVDDAAKLPQGSVLQMRFEDVVRDSRQWAERIAEFCEIDDGSEFVEYIATSAKPELAERWRGALDEETLALVRPHMEPLLKELGYEW